MHARLLLASLEAHRFPVRQHLVFDLLGVTLLEARRFPVPARRILLGHQRIADHLAPPHGAVRTLSIVRNQREGPHIVKEGLVVLGTAAGAKGPHDILAIVDINVVAHEDEAVDGVARLVVEDQVADALAQRFAVRLQGAQRGGVDAQRYPGHLRLEGREGVGDGEP